MTDDIMLIPNNVTIGPRTFRVKFVENLLDIEETQRLNGVQNIQYIEATIISL